MIRREKCFKRSLLWHLIKFLHRISAFLRVMFMFLEILYLKRGHGIEIHSPILHKSPVDRISCDQAGWFSLKEGYKNFHKLVLCNWKPPAASRAGQCNCHKGFSQIVIFLDPSCKMVQTELLCNFMVWHHNKAWPPTGNSDDQQYVRIDLPGRYQREPTSCIYGFSFLSTYFVKLPVHTFLSDASLVMQEKKRNYQSF